MLNKAKISKAAMLLVQICGGWWGIMSSTTSIPLAFFALFSNGNHQKWWFALLAIVALWVFAIRVVLKNYQLSRNGLPCLDIDGIASDIRSKERHPCLIRISSSKTADNVQVELLSLEDEMGEVGKVVRPLFPRIVEPESSGKTTINPGASIKFKLFDVVVFDAAKRTETNVISSKHFIAYFTTQATSDVVVFHWKKYYRLRLVATARDLPKTEREFFLQFVCNEGEFCRFNFIAVTDHTVKEAKEFNRAEIVETLGQFRFALLARADEINKMASDLYHEETNGELKTAGLLMQIEAYFNSNPIDLGTNALADLHSKENIDHTPIHCIFGTTVYHDEWQWAQQRLIQWEKNLIKIVRNLNAKPL